MELETLWESGLPQPPCSTHGLLLSPLADSATSATHPWSHQQPQPQSHSHLLGCSYRALEPQGLRVLQSGRAALLPAASRAAAPGSSTQPPRRSCQRQASSHSRGTTGTAGTRLHTGLFAPHQELIKCSRVCTSTFTQHLSGPSSHLCPQHRGREHGLEQICAGLCLSIR